jgi:hypothetical protein
MDATSFTLCQQILVGISRTVQSFPCDDFIAEASNLSEPPDAMIELALAVRTLQAEVLRVAAKYPPAPPAPITGEAP